MEHHTAAVQQSLWRNRDFTLFWFARVVSISGSTITAVVLPILMYQLTGSAIQTSLLTTLEVLPYFIFGLVAGALADRVNRKRLMVYTNLIQALLIASIPLASALDMLTLTQIYVVALLSMSAFVWFDAANFGALPALVGREHIMAANSAIWSASTVIGIVAPAVGGSLAAWLGAANTMSLDAASFLISAALLAAIPRAFNTAHPPEASDRPVLQQVLEAIREGLAFVWQHPLIRTMTLVGFGNSFSAGAVLGLLVVYAVRALGLSASDERIGLLYSSTAIGGLIASILLPILARRVGVGRITLVGLVAHLLLIVSVALAPTLIIGLVLLGLWSLCNTLIVVNSITLRQQVTPDHLQARVNTTARMIGWGGQPFGAATAGFLTEIFDVRTALLLVALSLVVSAIYGWFSPLRGA